MSRRWSYKVVELKAAFLGLKAEAMQQVLNQFCLQGWELVSFQKQGLNLRLYPQVGGVT